MPRFNQVYHDPSILPRLRPSKNPLSLQKGEWETLTNFRTTEGVIRARFGTTNLSSIVTSGTFRGAYVGQFENVETIVVATYIPDSLKVRVYLSTDAVTWTEITKQFNGDPSDTGIGPYGLTRMSDDGLVWFAVVQDRDVKTTTYPNSSYSQDVLVFANQSSSPRVYGRFWGGNSPAITNGAGTLQTAIIEDIAPPVEVQGTAVYAELFPTYTGLLIGDASFMDYLNSGASFVAVDNGASTTNNWVDLAIPAATTTGSTAVIYDNTTTRALLAGKQLHIGIETAWADFLNKIKIEVGDCNGVTFTSTATVYDPSTTTGNTTAVSNTISGNIKILSFDTEAFSSQTGRNAIRFTFLGPANATDQTAKIFLVAAGPSPQSHPTTGYANPGTTEWAIALYNSGTRTESRGVVYKNIDVLARIKVPNTAMVPTSYTNLTLPTSADLYYAYSLPLLNPTQAQIDKGVDSMRIYRKRPGDGDFFLLENYEMAQYTETAGPPPTGPTWSFVSGSASSVIRAYGLGREALTQTTYPDEFHVPMPKARCGIGTSDRVFVGTKVTGKPNLMVSAADQCFRFREINNIVDGDFVEDSAFALNLQGDTINGFAQVSGAAVGTLASDNIGISTVYCLGERYVYMTGGKFTSQLAQVSNTGIPGTVSPGSIVVNRNRLFFLDREMQVQMVRGGQSTTLSRQKVDSVLKAITNARKRYVWAAYYNDRYYLLYNPAAGTNTVPSSDNALVWSEEIGDWESFDRTPLACEAWFTWHDVSTDTVKLIALMQIVAASTTLRANSYDLDDLDDLGANIYVGGEAFDLHNDNWDVHTIDRICIVADKSANGTITWTVPYKITGSRTSTTSLSGSTSIIRRFDTNQVNTDPARGAASQLTFTGSVPGGWRLYNLWAEVETRAEPAERGDI